MPGIIIYARKSTESEDRQILSIDSQVKELTAFAEKEHLPVVQVYTETKSAKSPGRPVFNELLSHIQKGTVTGILCWKLDRLARNPVDGGALIWAMEEKNLQAIHTPQRSFANTGNDKFWMQLEFGMAKKYVDDLSDNTKRGLRAKLDLGWQPGLPPIGYLNDKEAKTIIPDPLRFPLVRRMWDLMLTGSYSPNAILRKATKEWGLRSRAFKRSGGGTVSYSGIYRLFTNPFYYGQIVYSGQSHKGKHKPMVTTTEFQAVQDLLNGRSRERPKTYKFAYVGLIRCGECGASITAERKMNRQGHRYLYYHCTKRKLNVRCSQGVVEVKNLERQIAEFLGSIAIPETLHEWALLACKELESADNTTQLSVRESLTARVAAVESEKSELLSVRLRHLISDYDFTRKSKELDQEQLNLTSSLSKLDDASKNVTAQCMKVLEFAVSASNRFLRGTDDQRRAILSFVGSNPTLYDKTLRISPQNPFYPLRNLRGVSIGKQPMFEPVSAAKLRAKRTPEGVTFSQVLRAVKDVRTFYRNQSISSISG